MTCWATEGFIKVIPLNWPRNWMHQDKSVLAARLRVMVPACSVASASKSLETKTLAPVVHLVAWKETLELPDWDGEGVEKFQAEVPGFFYLEWVEGHGEPDSVKNHSNPSDYGGGALALVRGCVQSQL